ncbi:aminotransferase class I/II-fold pyridoxal phosphate-dependent enzyme [Acinetobacter baumannii]|uniref:aminotransferase class I/II-fold pyridoxal phosphate-dependent enzyme n=1 Tax=Acinetobacter baumannii TaxID=470 RepID=UPI000BF749A6|nr:aminotransferase class I/II-fold pyridoxal phosphate-dependent enzyme [Acinetobacter baumannii]RYL20478.1 aminotransferase class I/II-fold pyridoxal phosphate-dependent enzyme [Acinetobacter baumannii]
MIFQHIPTYKGDPILSLMDDFKQDTHTQKVNLGIGLYYNDHGVVPQFKSVQQAHHNLTHILQNQASLYLPMEGLKNFRELTQVLLYGELNPAITQERRVATVQTIGVSGALKIGADFLKQYFPQAQVWVSQPTWENHIAIFQGARFTVHHYPYWNEETGQINFEEMCSCLRGIPKHSIVLLHPCCHNPTGMDLSNEQFDLLIDILQKQHLIPFLDLAYLGLGRGLVEDTYLIQQLLIKQVNFLGLCCTKI